ncbi:MAG: radical SAM protein [Erysipelotrichaceae bacterium]|nr:radical SAM protein [Erysipelotrichaceae bacterium]
MKRIYLEITDACNLNCPFCTYPKGHSFMPLDRIEDHLKQIKPICDYVYLHILGEPLLHPDFDQILCLLDQLEMSLQLVTNGILLPKHPDLLEHPCLRKLSVSVHSVNHLKIGNDYFDSLDQLILDPHGKNIELRFYDRDHLDDDLQAYLKHLENTYDFKDTSKSDSYEVKRHVYVYFSELFRWPEIRDPFLSDQGTCHGAIDMIAINVHSEVTLCCLDPLAYNSIGNLTDQSLQEILSSKQYLEHVEAFRQHRLLSPLCQRCSYRTRFSS